MKGKRNSSILITILLILTTFVSVDMEFEIIALSSATIIDVYDYPSTFYEIQEAINSAYDGDMIIVHSGTYASFSVNKRLDISVSGDVTIDGDVAGGFPGIQVLSDWANVTGFTIINIDFNHGIAVNSANNTIAMNTISGCGGDDSDYGIYLQSSCRDNVIDGNNVESCPKAIYLSGACENIIEDNYIYAPWYQAVQLVNSHNNIISSNDLYLGGPYGFYLDNSDGNEISSNTVDTYGGTAITILGGSDGNSVLDNTIIDVMEGIFIQSSSGNMISGNSISKGVNEIYFTYGIYQLDASNNSITNNSISEGQYGIYLESSTENLIGGNEITHIYYTTGSDPKAIWFKSSSSCEISNNVIRYNTYGLYLKSSGDNLIYHNSIIDNDIQAYDDHCSNQWHYGYPSGGNIWSNYRGSDFFRGPGQNISGSDGIGDTPYVIDSDSQDNYPLMDPIENFTYLRHGWNLVSTPFTQPSTQLDDVLSQLKGSYKAVMRYNATDFDDQWKNYLSVKPSHMNDLKTIDHTMGFWIYITESEDIVFDYSGIVPSQNQTINLYKGWNLVGYPSLSDKNRTQALNNLSFGQEIDAIWTYNVGAQRWEEVGGYNYFLVGKGYWIHAKSDCVWEVPL